MSKLTLELNNRPNNEHILIREGTLKLFLTKPKGTLLLIQELPATANWVGSQLGVSVKTSLFAATALSRYLSALEPNTCPIIDAAMVNAIAVLGISTDFLSMAMNGTAAWTAANQEGENFSVCSLHIPKGILAATPSTPITSIFVGRGCGRRFLAKAVRARALLAATTAGGHIRFRPGGGWRAFATRGRTWFTARYDFAIGQFPFCNHSLLVASCSDFPPWRTKEPSKAVSNHNTTKKIAYAGKVNSCQNVSRRLPLRKCPFWRTWISCF